MINGMTSITNYDDTIDSRDVIARIETLQGWKDDPNVGIDEDESQELADLQALAQQGEDFEDWAYGVTLIRDSYFEDYAWELAVDTGAISTEVSWPYTCIDWNKAASELQIDYTSIDFAGETYWAR